MTDLDSRTANAKRPGWMSPPGPPADLTAADAP
jgi:hypothetical protein